MGDGKREMLQEFGITMIVVLLSDYDFLGLNQCPSSTTMMVVPQAWLHHPHLPWVALCVSS